MGSPKDLVAATEAPPRSQTLSTIADSHTATVLRGVTKDGPALSAGEGVSCVRTPRAELRQDGEGIGPVVALSPATKPSASGAAGPAPEPEPPKK